MKTIRHILYATDFSESSGPAADYALTVTKLSGATLQVLHVVGEMADARRSMIPPSALEQLEKEVEVQAIREMEIFCKARFEGKVAYQSHVIVGNPFQEILQFAKSNQVDLIILGTHGRTGIEHVIVGSTAERIVRRSSVPVLVVPANR